MKKILSIFLVVTMVSSAMALTVSANDLNDNDTTHNTITDPVGDNEKENLSPSYDEDAIITDPNFVEPFHDAVMPRSFAGGAPAYDPGPEDFLSNESVAAREERAQKIAAWKNSRYISGSYQLNLTSVPTQARFNWCGPASAYTVLMYSNRQSPTQAALAREMGIATGSNGAYIHDMRDALDDRGVSVYSLNVGSSDLESDIEWSINHRIPVIAQVNTSSLRRYKGAIFYHYITVYGYAGNTIYYADNNNVTQYKGKFSDSYSNLEDSLWNHNGWYLAS